MNRGRPGTGDFLCAQSTKHNAATATAAATAAAEGGERKERKRKLLLFGFCECERRAQHFLAAWAGRPATRPYCCNYSLYVFKATPTQLSSATTSHSNDCNMDSSLLISRRFETLLAVIWHFTNES